MQNDRIEIVQLPVSDWPAYKRIRLEALQCEPQAFGSTYHDNREKPDSFWQARLADAAQGQGSWLLFAREAGQVVGMIGAMVEADEADTASIISVYVTRAARGKKVATLLMRAILSALKQRGIQTARLSVNPGQQAALTLYQRFGFRIMRTDPQQRMGNGEYVDEYVMEKRLAD